uniref:Uncharacterized protein n=1 Tax=Caenorhabditis japonica TaxID=281687 RepID=A0A8R1IMN4_CAEJA
MLIAESLGVQDTILFELIDQSSVYDVTDCIKLLIGVIKSIKFHNNTVNEIKMHFEQISFDETTPIKMLDQTWFSFDEPKIKIYPLPQTINTSVSFLKQISLADAMSSLNDVNIPPLNLESMITSLDLLESIYDEISLEAADFKKCIRNLQDLQLASLRRNGSLSKLLSLADLFFKSFFERQLKSEAHSLVSMLVFIISVFIISVSALFIFWIRSIKAIRG